ncbi:TetR/AcrR family transcriptional regulator [Mycolicibacterium sp. CBMA 226]|uniref:TetR/AcrR family transcriptional regulator n=1 Tax=Mycolicibacterium sp. CBMA 226 TaxID=2606611 RepID=UPI0014133BAA|nr:TetR/AcrR family transcriptional regulator [Mycolicibacterium sp. CBMA 226]
MIEAALDVFDERDFAGSTMEDIAGRANLNRGTIYLHFDSKSEILQAALRDLLPGELELFREFAAAHTRADTEAAYEHTLTAWRKLGRIWNHAQAAAAVDPAVRRWADAVFARQVRKVRRSLENSGMRPAVAEIRATLLVCMWSEFLPRWAAGESNRSRKATAAALTDFLEAAQKVV